MNMNRMIYALSATGLKGSEIRLADYIGKVLLIVNTASECGFTPQYAGLEKLWRDYSGKGLIVLGFPCNQFGGQEPGSAGDIGSFCQKSFDVTFPLAAKVDVNGPNAHPLYKFLTEQAPGLLGSKAIKWNFTKFLVDRQGHVVSRHAPTTKPEDLAQEIERLLAQA